MISNGAAVMSVDTLVNTPPESSPHACISCARTQKLCNRVKPICMCCMLSATRCQYEEGSAGAVATLEQVRAAQQHQRRQMLVRLAYQQRFGSNASMVVFEKDQQRNAVNFVNSVSSSKSREQRPPTPIPYTLSQQRLVAVDIHQPQLLHAPVRHHSSAIPDSSVSDQTEISTTRGVQYAQRLVPGPGTQRFHPYTSSATTARPSDVHYTHRNHQPPRIAGQPARHIPMQSQQQLQQQQPQQQQELPHHQHQQQLPHQQQHQQQIPPQQQQQHPQAQISRQQHMVSPVNPAIHPTPRRLHPTTEPSLPEEARPALSTALCESVQKPSSAGQNDECEMIAPACEALIPNRTPHFIQPHLGVSTQQQNPTLQQHQQHQSHRWGNYSLSQIEQVKALQLHQRQLQMQSQYQRRHQQQQQQLNQQQQLIQQHQLQQRHQQLQQQQLQPVAHFLPNEPIPQPCPQARLQHLQQRQYQLQLQKLEQQRVAASLSNERVESRIPPAIHSNRETASPSNPAPPPPQPPQPPPPSQECIPEEEDIFYEPRVVMIPRSRSQLQKQQQQQQQQYQHQQKQQQRHQMLQNHSNYRNQPEYRNQHELLQRQRNFQLQQQEQLDQHRMHAYHQNKPARIYPAAITTAAVYAVEAPQSGEWSHSNTRQHRIQLQQRPQQVKQQHPPSNEQYKYEHIPFPRPSHLEVGSNRNNPNRSQSSPIGEYRTVEAGSYVGGGRVVVVGPEFVPTEAAAFAAGGGTGPVRMMQQKQRQHDLHAEIREFSPPSSLSTN
ncbi:hypothetical protein BDR26DRAFT_850930 [Obelidium mucronatum]|nr:hypothetical protein BDR26DRAFT_850930 [Obelidium mucronatum]